MQFRSPVCPKTLSLAAILCLGLLSGCSAFHSRAKKKPAVAEKDGTKPDPRGTPVKQGVWAHSLGKVILVNEGMGFVLVDIGTAPAPEPGVPLQAFTDALPSAQLVVSNYQRRPYLIGDIVSGMPRKGDSIALAPKKIQASQKPAESLRAREGSEVKGMEGGEEPRPIRNQGPQPPRIPAEQSVTQFLPFERENPVSESIQEEGETKGRAENQPDAKSSDPIIPGIPVRRRAK